MIPKKIHFCWFGNNPKSESILKNIDSWKKYNTDYEIFEWNESNCDISENIFIRKAYEQKKYAFVSDMIRVKKVYEHGGFYLDTDMQVTSSFDELREYDCVCGFELLKKPFSAFFGSIEKHVFVKDMLNYYMVQKDFVMESNTNLFSKLLIDKYGANHLKDEFQLLQNNIALFPSAAFSLDIPKNYVIHHFEGSWLDNNQTFFKQYVNMYGVLNELIASKNSKETIHHLIHHNKIFTTEQILDKIPLKYIVKYLLQKVKSKFIK